MLYCCVCLACVCLYVLVFNSVVCEFQCGYNVLFKPVVHCLQYCGFFCNMIVAYEFMQDAIFKSKKAIALYSSMWSSMSGSMPSSMYVCMFVECDACRSA